MSHSRLGGGAPARRAMVRWTCRLARRDWRQHVTIVVLVTLGVAATVFLSSAAYNIAPASGVAEFGDAQRVFFYDLDRDQVALADWLDRGREAFGTIDTIAQHTVAVPGSSHNVDFRAQDIAGAFSDPLLDLRAGRAPVSAGEAAVTDGVADLLSVSIGDSIALDGVERRVVGTVENPSDLNDEFVLLPATELADATTVMMLTGDVPDGADRFSAMGPIRVAERNDVQEDVLAGVLMLLACSILLVLVALVASASFAVIAQRRLPQLGMLSAIGATERHLRLSMVASGAVTGAFAAVAGVVIGAGTWILLAPLMESLVDHRIDTANIPWWIVLAGASLAVLTATAAAWWPARAMSRIPTVMALSGRTPRPTSGERSALLAVGLVAGGVAALFAGSDFHERGPNTVETMLLVVGTVAVIAGVLLVSPLVIRGVGRVAGRLPIAGRLAVRDLSRYRARSSAALAAIGLALGIPAVIVASMAAAQNTSPLGNLADNQLLVRPEQFDTPFIPNETRLAEMSQGVTELAAEIPMASVVRFDAVVNPAVPPDPGLNETLSMGIDRRRDDGWQRVATLYAATPELLAALDVEPESLPADMIATSASGDDLYLLFGSPIRTDANSGASASPGREPLTEAGTLPATYTSLPAALVDPAVASARGWEVVGVGQWLLETDEPLDDEQIDTAREIAARHGFVVETRDDESDLAMIRLGSGLIGTLLALGVLAATVGLIRGESANEMRTLTATGASRSVRRGITAVTAGTLAALGAALGIASAYIGLVAGRVDHLTPLPWRDLALIAIGAPLVATCAGWLLAGREPVAIARRPID